MPIPIQVQLAAAMQELDVCNSLSRHYGLLLTEKQMLQLTEHRFQTLKATGRTEFGEGILKKLVTAFCDSPYITQRNYEETLGELQSIFYYFKNESEDTLSDDELIEAMKSVFGGKAQGSLDYLEGTALENLCRIIRGGEAEEDEESQEEEEYEE
ncbi:DUF6323 family protein [Oscillospiraceae bacterium MB08-C2-2]|nr:DUF6323 family protein [Oscillospiraceae bacterium MB08-C2-2]